MALSVGRAAAPAVVRAGASPTSVWASTDKSQNTKRAISGVSNDANKQGLMQKDDKSSADAKRKTSKKVTHQPILSNDLGRFVFVQGPEGEQFLAMLHAPVVLDDLLAASAPMDAAQQPMTVSVAWCYHQSDLGAKHANLFRDVRHGCTYYLLSDHIEDIEVATIVRPVHVNLPSPLQYPAALAANRRDTLSSLFLMPVLFLADENKTVAWKTPAKIADLSLGHGLREWLRVLLESAPVSELGARGGRATFWANERSVPAVAASAAAAAAAASRATSKSGKASAAAAGAAPMSIRTALREQFRARALASVDPAAPAPLAHVPSYFKAGEAASGRRQTEAEAIAVSDVSAEDAELVQARMLVYRQQLADLADSRALKKIALVREALPFLTDAEVEAAFAEIDNADPDDLIVRFSTDREFLLNVRERVAARRTSTSRKRRRATTTRGAIGNLRGVSSGESRSSLIQSVMSSLEGDGQPRRHHVTEHVNNVANAAPSRLRESLVVVNREAEQELVPQLVTPENNVRLGDAVPAPEDKGALIKLMEGWSDARVKAYRHIDTNPNAYYYRFNDPGEATRKGSFTPAEHAAFMERLAEIGPGRWGIFSMSMPGRVGYQCSGHYRRLIEAGVIHDANYALDETGRARYLEDDGNYRCHPRIGGEGSASPGGTVHQPAAAAGGGGASASGSPSRKRKHSLPTVSPSSSSVAAAAAPSLPGAGGAGPKPAKKRKLFVGEDTSGEVAGVVPRPPSRATTTKKKPLSKAKKAATRDERELAALVEDMENEWKPSAAFYSTKRLRGLTGSAVAYVNPLPDYRDPITYEAVEAPALSPYGHVCGHATWRKALADKEVCPFTGRPLTLRELITLTPENIEEYRSRIVLL